MRCNKCGKIIYDYLETCTFCNADLKGSKDMLGDFTVPNEFSWFDTSENRRLKKEDHSSEALDQDFSDIDVSDLLGDEKKEAIDLEEDSEVILEIDEDEMAKMSSESEASEASELVMEAEEEDITFLPEEIQENEMELDAVTESQPIQESIESQGTYEVDPEELEAFSMDEDILKKFDSLSESEWNKAEQEEKATQDFNSPYEIDPSDLEDLSLDEDFQKDFSSIE
jgi:hypothetical protein